MILVRAAGLRKTFRNKGHSLVALDRVSFDIEAGQTYGLVGESGCGKSTVALSLLRLQGLDSGLIYYRGRNLLDVPGGQMRELRRNMRMLFQNPEAVLNSGMTLRQVLMEELEKEPGLSGTSKRERIEMTIAQVGLRPLHLARHPAGLSTGEKQRAGIARALITRPDFVICDEPVASLDLSLKATIVQLLLVLQKEFGITYLYISHNLGTVRRLAHRIGVMYMGHLVEEAPVRQFHVESVLHPYSRLLLASVPGDDPEGNREVLKDFPDVEPERFEEGCPFRNRCPLYRKNPLEECKAQRPPLRTYAAGHRAACHQI